MFGKKLISLLLGDSNLNNNREWLESLKKRFMSDHVYFGLLCQILGYWPLSWYRLRQNGLPDSVDRLEEFLPSTQSDFKFLLLIGQFAGMVNNNSAPDTLRGEVFPFLIGIYEMSFVTNNAEDLLIRMYQSCSGPAKIIPSLLLTLNEAGPPAIRFKIDPKESRRSLKEVVNYQEQLRRDYTVKKDTKVAENLCSLCLQTTNFTEVW